MNSTHTIYFSPSQTMSQLNDNSVDLVITSPPYPMIEMWDEIMSNQNPAIRNAFERNAPSIAFDLMHQELDKVWKECFRVLKNGGFLCINIGDATRTINGDFRLYNNHSRITSFCLSLGFANLPNIIWRKQTNAPNKFMGSGMLPCGAYVTLEHEYVLVFRKGSKREYKTKESKLQRRQSSFFWEERNIWFSDLWDLKGVKQKIGNSETRDRSAAFPLEIPFRIINMYSQKGDVVLDPFVGTGTTTQAAILLGRNSIGYEIDKGFAPLIEDNVLSWKVSSMNTLIKERFDAHLNFIKERTKNNGAPSHFNQYLGCSVMTGQEEDLEFHYLTDVSCEKKMPLCFNALYEEKSDLTSLPKAEGLLF